LEAATGRKDESKGQEACRLKAKVLIKNGKEEVPVHQSELALCGSRGLVLRDKTVAKKG
jgi:hypothetical protein